MHEKKSDILFHTAGGRVPLTLLRRLAELALVHGNGHVALGSRQELIVCAVPSSGRDRVRQGIGPLMPEHHPRRPNIVTTRVATGRSHRTPWLSEGAYDHVLESFTSPPALPVNLSDPRQPYTPLFTGQLHFVASGEPEYWHVLFAAEKQAPQTRLAGAVHSAGVAPVARLIQGALAWSGGADLSRLQALMERQLAGQLREVEPLHLKAALDSRPITGFVLDVASGNYSLGIPAQSSPISAQFLVDLSMLGRSIDLATAYLTPWKSLVLHGIPREHRAAFESLLLRRRVNLAPGAWDSVCFNDLRTPKAASAGARLIESLNEAYPHPGSLRIGLVEGSALAPDTPIIVRAESSVGARWPFSAPRFAVYVREGYDPFSTVLPRKARQVRGGVALRDAVFAAIDDFASDKPQPAKSAPAPAREPKRGTPAHRCVECGTEYNPLYGDPLGKIEPGTPFFELPATWRCPTCEAPVDSFRPFHGAAA